LFILSRCTSTRPEDLPPFPVEIDTARDTILHTPNGALIHISAHALTAGDASRVRLIIRQNEDFIDIETAKDQPLTFAKTIYVALPKPNPEKNKWLYKGTIDPDGRLRFWKDPQPLISFPPSKDFSRGKELFSVNCVACHNLQFTVEPDILHGATQRHDRQWLRAFTRNSKELIASGDPYANALYNQFNKTAMPTYTQMSDADIDDIYRYIDEDAVRRHPPFPDSLMNKPPNSYYQFPINEPGWYHLDIRPPSQP